MQCILQLSFFLVQASLWNSSQPLLSIVLLAYPLASIFASFFLRYSPFFYSDDMSYPLQSLESSIPRYFCSYVHKLIYWFQFIIRGTMYGCICATLAYSVLISSPVCCFVAYKIQSSYLYPFSPVRKGRRLFETSLYTWFKKYFLTTSGRRVPKVLKQFLS